MKIIVDKKSLISVHDQIYNEIENRIMSGLLEAESKLPSLRKMCSDIGVSHMTMVKVYSALEENGLVEKIHGKGTFVKSQFRNMTPAQAEQSINLLSYINESENSKKNKSLQWQEDISDYVSVGGFRANSNLNHSNQGINLSIACLGPHLVPSERVLDLFLKNPKLAGKINDLYPPIEGLDDMRQAARQVLNQRNVDLSLEQTVITVGSQQAIRLIARTFIGPGDVVVVSAPTYPGALDIFKNRGARLMEVPLDDEGMDVEALIAICEKYPVKMVYTMPSFHNPTGVVMSLKRKKELLELADYHNFIILEDDVCGQLSYDINTIPLKALDEKGRVLYVFGFSKIYGHAYRLSVIGGATKLLEKIVSAKSSSDGGAPLINQLIMSNFIGSDAQKHYLTDISSHLKRVRDEAYLALMRYMPSYVEVHKPSGGMLFWLTFPKTFNCNLLHYKCIEKYNINFLPGEFCYNSKQGRNQMRLCFTSVPKDVFIKSIKNIAEIVDEVYKISKLI
ncbi:PLP-dependent aminotransferase family protein [Fusibacter sp. JL216-2]|uniref:aminotransferase-like domain-containing protein n=1 Tax=Fusibacter sp. JL216-2 TaxID=3071453 RepID=UPI003D33E647